MTKTRKGRSVFWYAADCPRLALLQMAKSFLSEDAFDFVHEIKAVLCLVDEEFLVAVGDEPLHGLDVGAECRRRLTATS